MKYAFMSCGLTLGTFGLFNANIWMFIAAVGMLTAGATASMIQDGGKR